MPLIQDHVVQMAAISTRLNNSICAGGKRPVWNKYMHSNINIEVYRPVWRPVEVELPARRSTSRHQGGGRGNRLEFSVTCERVPRVLRMAGQMLVTGT
jgi:hypothetical protein